MHSDETRPLTPASQDCAEAPGWDDITLLLSGMWAGEFCFHHFSVLTPKTLTLRVKNSQELKVLESSVIFKSAKGPVIKTVETSGTGLPWGVQQSRLSASNARGLNSIPDQGVTTPRTACYSQKHF